MDIRNKAINNLIEKGLPEHLAPLAADAVLEVLTPSTPPILRNGPLELDTQKHTVTYRAQVIKLTRTEYRFVKLLMLKMGSVVMLKESLNYVWGPDHADNMTSYSQYVRVLVSNIRKKFNDPTIIKARQGFGGYYMDII